MNRRNQARKKRDTSRALLFICIVLVGLVCLSAFAARIVLFPDTSPPPSIIFNDQNNALRTQTRENEIPQNNIVISSTMITSNSSSITSLSSDISNSVLIKTIASSPPPPLPEPQTFPQKDLQHLEKEKDKVVDIVSSYNNKKEMTISSDSNTDSERSDSNVLFLEDDGRGSYGYQWRPIDKVKLDDWFVYIRIQKTGSQTFWQTLQNSFDGRVWGRRTACQKGLFCGAACLKVVEEQVSTILTSRMSHKGNKGQKHRIKDPNQCSLVFRGHINLYDYIYGFNHMIKNSNLIQLSEQNELEQQSQSNTVIQQQSQSNTVVKVDRAYVIPHRVFFITFLRSPINRVVSEYRHITEGIVAQFGPHTFGAAWDYNFTFFPKMKIEEKRKRGSFAAWIACDQCRVGSRNRMTRFLSGVATTGELLPQEVATQTGELLPQEVATPPPESLKQAEGNMLKRAKKHLYTCAFLGLMERYEDSMLVLKHTFPSALAKMNSYSTSPHPKTKYVSKISEKEMELIAELNQLDISLYAHAKDLFERRFQSMKQSLPRDKAKLAFISTNNGKQAKGSRGTFRLQ